MRDRGVVSVVIPARNESARIAEVIESVSNQTDVDLEVEILVVDDGSTDDTVERAKAAGANVIELASSASEGSPARARNIGASKSRGDPIVFLDADCLPASTWLCSLLEAHRDGAQVVGGALALPSGLGVTARCDYYCGCFYIHSRRDPAWVPHHPPNNLSVSRQAFLSTSGFVERSPLRYTNEERYWQAELRHKRIGIFFAPTAVVEHFDRPGLGNLLRRSYRWGYTAIEAKAETGSTRASWLFSRPWLVLVVSPLIPFAMTIQVVLSWLRAGSFEPLLLTPMIFVSRVAYTLGMVVGGLRWLAARASGTERDRPSPRWK